MEHEQIEAQLDIPNRITDPSAYRALLSGFLTFYEPMEHALSKLDWDGAGIDFKSRRKTQLLAADLQACEVNTADLRRCRTLPPVTTPAQGLGCLYVMEGATIGGQVVHRMLRKHLGPWIDDRSRFFQCYGTEKGNRWREFREALDAFGAVHDEALQQETIDSARTTFRCLRQWLDQHTNHPPSEL